MDGELIVECTCAAMINAAVDAIDIPGWLFGLHDAEYQRCSPAHVAAAATASDDGRRMSINVETIGGFLMVQHYVEEHAARDHCLLASTSDLLTPTGWTKVGVFWELSIRPTAKNRCELTNHVGVRSTPEFIRFISRAGIPLQQIRQSLEAPTIAHNADETASFAASLESAALNRRLPAQ